jgi:hypothetical protein
MHRKASGRSWLLLRSGPGRQSIQQLSHIAHRGQVQVAQPQCAAAEQCGQLIVRDLPEFRLVKQVKIVELEGFAGISIESRALQDEDAADLGAAGSHRHQDGDVLVLRQHDHGERDEDVERGDQNDEADGDRGDGALHFQGVEKRQERPFAETVAAAKDAAELIDIEYEPLPAVVETAAAAEPSAPRLWDHARSNVCLDAEIGGDGHFVDRISDMVEPLEQLRAFVRVGLGL